MRAPLPLAAAALLAAGTLMPAAGWAQSGPNADQIVKSLTPSGTLGGNTRGIRLAKPGAAPAEQAPSVSLNVNFATGSAELTPQATRELDELGKALTAAQLASYRFRVEGHTDTVGGAALNQALSERRAASVVDYLETKFNIGKTRLQAVGMGEHGLLVPTPPNTPDPRNRRVLVVNVGS